MKILFSCRDENTAWVTPAVFLQTHFTIFRDTLSANGAVYDSAKKKSWIGLSKVRVLGAALQAAGFAPAGDTAFKAALQAYDHMIVNHSAAAQERMDAINLRLKEKGQALYPYQVEGINYLATKDAALLADPPGLGKTLQMLLSAPEDYPILVVCPAIAKSVWFAEPKKWRPDLKVTTFSGRGSFRWPEKGELCIINYDLLPPTAAEYRELIEKLTEEMRSFTALEAKIQQTKLARPDFDDEAFRLNSEDYKKYSKQITLLWARAESYADWMLPSDARAQKMVLIFDEIHALKSPKSARYIRAKALCLQVREKNGRLFGATGTPIMSRPPELWALLNVLGLAILAFGSWLRFKALFNARPGQFAGTVWGLPKPEVAPLLRRVMLRREREDALPQLPVKTYSSVQVPIDKATLKLCEAAMSTLTSRGISVDDLDSIVRQTAKDSALFEEMSKARQALATMKTSAALEFVEELEEAGEPVIVFCSHRPPIDSFHKREGWATITGSTSESDRAKIVNLFQNGKLKGVAITIKAGATALTLTAARYVVFIDRDWVPALNEQAEDRALRIGQTRGVQIINLVADHALDYRVHEVLLQKQTLVTKTLLGG